MSLVRENWKLTVFFYASYAPRYVYVEVFLVEDGSRDIDYYRQYLGTYMLLEQITRFSGLNLKGVSVLAHPFLFLGEASE